MESESQASPPVVVKVQTGGSRLRVRDDQLDDLLRLAGGCLRSGRYPGEPRIRDILARFDAEADAQKALEEQEDADAEATTTAAAASASRSSADGGAVMEAPHGNAPHAPAARSKQTQLSDVDRTVDPSKLRREIAELERQNTEKRMELQDAKLQLSKQVIENSNAREKLESVEAEVKRLSKELKLARMHSNRHETEIQELHQALEEAVQRPASVPANTEKGPRPPAGPRPEKSKGARGGSARRPKPSGPRDSSRSEGDNTGPSDRLPDSFLLSEDGFEQTTLPLQVDELKSVLLGDQEQHPGEAALWKHFQCENDKLVSVIDAVGELHQQLNHSPEVQVHLPAPQRRGGVTPPPPRKHWTYSSVLSQGYQKYRKLYI